MGMFSWKCKGCGGELVMNELVRLNGFKGEYDGYGGTGSFQIEDDFDNIVAWHQECYDKATPEQKLDETPSPSAPNQGFGYPQYKFLAPYKPEYYVLKSVALVDAEDKYEDDDRSPEWLAYKKEFPLSELEHCYVENKFKPHLMGDGGFRYDRFHTLEEARAVAEEHLPNFPEINIIAMGEGDGIIETLVNKEKKAELDAYNKKQNDTFQKYIEERWKRQEEERAAQQK